MVSQPGKTSGEAGGPAPAERAGATTIRVPKEFRRELWYAARAMFKVIPASRAVEFWPRSPCCGALLMQDPVTEHLVCWKCKKRYVLSEVKAISGARL